MSTNMTQPETAPSEPSPAATEPSTAAPSKTAPTTTVTNASGTPRSRAEVTTKSIQIVLLGLGGLLLAAALVVFTAVAWRDLGDDGRLIVLAGFTGLGLAVPPALAKFHLWATAETLAATATLALWCSALAGYYLYLPEGASLNAPAVAAWTTLVLAAAAVYRLATGLGSPAWALLPLAATGASFAAVGDAFEAGAHMGVIAAVLALASWTIRVRPTRHAHADQWAARVLLCAGIITVFMAGLRVTFGLDTAVLPMAAAATSLLAATGLLAAAQARHEHASAPSVIVLASATGALIVAAWILAGRSADPFLAVPGFALLAAAMVVLAAWTDPTGPAWLPTAAGAAAAVASLGTLGAVLTDGFELVAYAGAALLALALAPVFPATLRLALRHGATAVGIGVLTWCLGVALSALPAAYGAVPHAGLRWQTAAVAAVCAVGAPLVPRRMRRDFLAMVTAVASLCAAGLAGDQWAVTGAFTLVFIAALVVAFGSHAATRRAPAWIAAFAWLGATALAAPQVDLGPLGSDLRELPLAVCGAGLLAARHVSFRGGGPERIATLVAGHLAMAGHLCWLLLESWRSAGIQSLPIQAPLAVLAYAAVLAVGAWSTGAHRARYVLGSCAAATAGHLLLAARESATVLEWYTAPPAMALFAIGLWTLRRRPNLGSWAALAPALALGFAPSLATAFGPDAEPLRRVLLGGAALAVLLVAAWRRWQAPLVVAGLVLASLCVNESLLLWSRVPKWIPLAVGGAVLIAAGATLEQRRRDLARLSGTVRSMR